MGNQEKKIINLLLNYIAIEGALNHFNIQMPNDRNYKGNREDIQRNPPQKWNRTTQTYEDDPHTTCCTNNFSYSWYCLKIIRNNLFHANKAMKPEPPERLNFLLNWSEKFIKKVYTEDSDLAKKAKEIKETLKIKSY